MSFFQLRSVPGSVWPPLPAPELSQVWSAYLELDRTQWLSPAEVEARQLRQLHALLLHCFEQVPYYRHVLSEADFPARPISTAADLRRLPVLTRELYQANFAGLRARALPPGMREVGSSYTSGTNGVPIQVLKTDRVGVWWHAFYLRDLEWSGLDPRGSLAAIRFFSVPREELAPCLEGISTPCWNPSLAALIETGPAYGMDIRQDAPRQLDWLRRLDPDYLLSYPTNLEHLARLLAEEGGQRLPRLRAVQAIGETVSDADRAVIEAGFGVPLKNLYSTTEAGYMASPCPAGHGLHVHAENVLAEVLDADGHPCRPGQTGRLVFTALHNFLTPFVRYDILDDVTLAPGPCPCGRGLPLLTGIEGRKHPLIHLPDGRRRVVSGLYREVRRVGGSHQFQIVQRAVDHVIIRVVPDRTWTADHAARMREVVRQEFEAPIRVDVEERPRLEVPRGGKLKIAVIEMEGGATPP